MSAICQQYANQVKALINHAEGRVDFLGKNDIS